MARLVRAWPANQRGEGERTRARLRLCFRENEDGGNVNEHGRASERCFVFFLLLMFGFFLLFNKKILKAGFVFFFIFGLIFFQKRTRRLGIKRVSQHENTEECNYHFARQLLL